MIEAATIREAREALESLPVSHALRLRHSEPWRHYHTWEHVTAILDHLERAERDGVEIHDPISCVAFSEWHDSVYYVHAPSGMNEALSSRLCASESADILSPASVRRACGGIEATAAHRAPDPTAFPDAALQLDADLSILGAPKHVFDVYEDQIRAEYAHVLPKDYAEARASILSRFLERSTLYLTEWSRVQWERQARRNLESSIAALRRSVGILP